jgi:hypothetical protein
MPFLDRVQMTISSASGSAVTLGSVYAANAATMVGAGAVDGAKYSYVISDGNNFELQKQQVYSAGAGTIARGTPVLAFNGTTYSTTQLSTVSGSAVFAIDLLAEDLNGFASIDGNGNFSANNLIEGFATTATAAGTTTLTIASAGIQAFTGTTTQTVKLPTTGLVAGQQYLLINNSTGVVTVQSSGANTIQAMAAGTSAFFTANVATPTTAAQWNVNYSGAYLGLTPAAIGALANGTTSAVTVGYTFTPNSLGNITSFTVNPALGNYQYGTNHAAATWTAPTSDCAVTILVTNDATAGAITFSGFTVGSSTGDALTTTNASKFLINIIRINGVSTYMIKALQ